MRENAFIHLFFAKRKKGLQRSERTAPFARKSQTYVQSSTVVIWVRAGARISIKSHNALKAL
jgi:hypothetical protein